MLFGVSHGHRAFACGHLDAGGEGICALDTVSEGSSPVAVSTHDGWAGSSPAQPAPILVLGDVPDRLLPQATDSFQFLQQPDRPRPDCHVSGHSTHQSMAEPQQAAFRPQRTRSRNLLPNRHSRGQNLRPSLDLPCLGTQLVHQPDRDCRSCGADEQIADADKARRTARVIQSAWTRSLS
jgi:hypothetical protein